MTLSTGQNLGLLVDGALGETHYTELMRQWRGLDFLIMPAVAARVASLPTSGMGNGDRYLNTSNGNLYRWTTALNPAAWEAFTPKEGWYVWSVAETKLFRFKGGQWAADSSGGGGTGFDNPMTDPGDLIVGGVSGTPTRFARGAVGKILSATSNGLAWIDAPTGGGGGTSSGEKYSTASPSNSRVNLSDAATTVWGITMSSNFELFLPTSTTIPVLALALIFQQDGTGGRTVTWPSSITWNGGSPPTISSSANSKTLVSLLSVDGGTSWLGMTIGVSGGGSFSGGKITGELVFADQGVVASDTTATLANVASNLVSVSGESTISSFGLAPAGTFKIVTFISGLTLKNGDDLVLPGNADIVVRPGDSLIANCPVANSWRVRFYQRRDGTSLVGGSGGGGGDATKMPLAGGTFTGNVIFGPKLDIDSQDTVDLMSVDSNNVEIQGTQRIVSFGTGVRGAMKFVTFGTSGVTLRHSDGVLDVPGKRDIVAQQYDWLLAHCVADNNWRIRVYQRHDGSPIVPETAMVQINSDTTTDIGAVGAQVVDLVYANTQLITSFGTAPRGTRRTVTRTGRNVNGLINQDSAPITLKYDADTLVLPGRQDIIMVIGDSIELESLGGGKWHGTNYQRGDGAPLVFRPPMFSIQSLPPASANAGNDYKIIWVPDAAGEAKLCWCNPKVGGWCLINTSTPVS